MIRRLLFVFTCLALGHLSAAEKFSPVILISLDGFRWDYADLHPNESATLRQLKREGVSAKGLIPAFPSNTFPNHYSIVTGLYPSNHGIVNNDFLDADTGEIFRYNQPTVATAAKWWKGEPIWVTAIKQGQRSASAFWVGSEAEIGGVRPTFWRRYDYSIPFAKRLEELSSWFKLPPEQRPSVVTFYFEEVNGSGHKFGPDSKELIASVALVDAGIRQILERLRSENVEPNLIVVSDHGMTPTALARVDILDDYLDLKTVNLDTDGSGVALRPLDGDVSALLAKVKKIPHGRAYRVEDLPAHLKLKPGPRVAPIWILPEEGWHVASRATYDRLKTRFAATRYIAGDHGYDPALRSMHGIFIAHGPAFRSGVEIPALENVHVYNLLCALLKLKPAPNDGDDRLVRAALKE